MVANDILNQFKSYPDAWTIVDQILEKSQNANTKFYALQILDEAVNVRIYNILLIIGVDQVENSPREPEIRNQSLHHSVGTQTLRR